MKTKRAGVFFLSLFLLAGLTASAAELASQGTRTRKLQRGLLNTAFAPLEIFHQLEEVKSQDKWLATWIPAGFWGSVYMVIRAFTGIYEVATFPIPSPPNYRPILKPEFALEHIGILKSGADRTPEQ